jgi:DNA-directed RNA polymerase I, II, and III subunit RPABC1
MSNEEDQVSKATEATNLANAKLWRAWKTIHEMVEARGYTMAEHEVKVTLSDFVNRHADASGLVR